MIDSAENKNLIKYKEIYSSDNSTMIFATNMNIAASTRRSKIKKSLKKYVDKRPVIIPNRSNPKNSMA